MAAIDFALTTLGTIKQDLLIDPTDTAQDAALTRAILAATDRVQSYLGRKLCYREGLIETFQDQDMQRYLRLKSYPVREIVSVESLDSDGTQDELIDAADYDIQGDSGLLFYRRGSWYDSGRTLWPDVAHPPFRGNSRPRWRITYHAGYYGPNQTGLERDLPYDIEQATLIYAKSSFLNSDQDFRLVREHLLEAANWFDNESMEREITRLLAPYKSIIQSSR